MKSFLLSAVATSALAAALLQPETKSPPKSNLTLALRLVAETESGVDYKKRSYTSYTWSVKNDGARNVWLPLPKDRSVPKVTSARAFRHRAKISGSWPPRWLAVHEVDYEDDWVVLPPGEKYQLFATTFYEGDERFTEVEVSLTYKDDGGKVRAGRLSWSTASPPYNRHMQWERAGP